MKVLKSSSLNSHRERARMPVSREELESVVSKARDVLQQKAKEINALQKRLSGLVKKLANAQRQDPALYRADVELKGDLEAYGFAHIVDELRDYVASLSSIGRDEFE